MCPEVIQEEELDRINVKTTSTVSRANIHRISFYCLSRYSEPKGLACEKTKGWENNSPFSDSDSDRSAAAICSQ